MNELQRLLASLDGDVFDLSRPYVIGMPQSPNHPRYWHSLPRRHGDMVRADGGSAANDLIVMGTHVGTHIDALAHVSHDGVLHGGRDAAAAQVGGRFEESGVHTVAPFIGRGVLLDIPAARGVDALPAGEEVTAADVADAEASLPAPIRQGDGVLIRTGWGANWEAGDAYLGKESGVPGPGPEAAGLLASKRPAFIGSDSIAFEHLPPGGGHAVLPVHRILLVEHGINIVETLALEELAAAGHREFLLVLVPLPLVGATGSPVRPLAIVPRP
ncbi:MAG TPA: cyclase family protein [Acidimicrobiia bacterium]|jgi:kynurenine formamidase|nr:cyclase family protein [Acidimicrobiia bacterium]